MDLLKTKKLRSRCDNVRYVTHEVGTNSAKGIAKFSPHKWWSQFDHYSSEFLKIFRGTPEHLCGAFVIPLCCLGFKKLWQHLSNINKSLEFSNTAWTTDASMGGGLIFKRLQGGYWPPGPFLDVTWGARHFLMWVSSRWPSENSSKYTREDEAANADGRCWLTNRHHVAAFPAAAAAEISDEVATRIDLHANT